MHIYFYSTYKTRLDSNRLNNGTLQYPGSVTDSVFLFFCEFFYQMPTDWPLRLHRFRQHSSVAAVTKTTKHSGVNREKVVINLNLLNCCCDCKIMYERMAEDDMGFKKMKLVANLFEFKVIYRVSKSITSG